MNAPQHPPHLHGTEFAVGAIVAAIITAAVAAATAAATTLQTGLSSSDRGATIDNTTTASFSLRVAAEPSHGRWGDSPPSTIDALPSAQTMFDAWKQSGDAPSSVMSITDVNDLDGAQQQLLIAWISTDTSAFAGTNVDLSLTAQGEGVESVAVYYSSDGQVALAVFLQHKPNSGTTYAGATISGQDWMENMINSDDAYLSNLINHIKTISSQYTQLSTGQSCTVTSGSYSCTFTAASVTTYQLSTT